jgi:hypothetical protein
MVFHLPRNEPMRIGSLDATWSEPLLLPASVAEKGGLRIAVS